MIIKSYTQPLTPDPGYVYVTEHDCIPYIRQSILEYCTQQQAQAALDNILKHSK